VYEWQFFFLYDGEELLRGTGVRERELAAEKFLNASAKMVCVIIDG
jgi:hypothetical protein